MKKIALAIALISGSALADNNVKLNKVTLFIQGAELQGQSTVSLTKGESEIVLTGIANEVKPNTINVGFGNNSDVRVLSTSFNDKYLANIRNAEDIQSIIEKQKQLQEKRDTVEIQLKAVKEQILLLQGNRLDTLAKKGPDDLTAMKNVLDFVKTNMTTSLNEQNRLQKEVVQLDEQISEYQKQLDEKQTNNGKLHNAVIVKVASDKDITLPITLSYITTKAGWEPAYDVRVADINSPLQLTYKAEIHQNTGLDWQDVDFSLSTSNPSKNITPPDFNPWYIDVYNEKSGLFFSSSEKQEYYERDAKSKLVNPSQIGNVNTLGINTQFDIKLPYTIKNDSKNNIITLQTKDVKANYQYVSMPKFNNSVYLLAQINDWDKLNLLSGKANIFFSGNFMGETMISTKNTKGSLDFSLGRDKNILVSRNRNIKETSTPTLFGDDVSEKYAYTIEVKNTKALPINIIVKDQLPVILNKAVTLNDTKYDGAKYDKQTGLLTWQFTLNPSESKNLNLSFKITYPDGKERDIYGL
ncbi:mucoidy inhibitor MuiA family protein [Gilliamella sp. ESL0441]|uniref:DUF4139 domain-containing protein n=1 Tax=Gilliamella sp. ESL0441 TaxID=2704654 RepID=UPI001C6A1D6A|nr:DUF4139 domain-containing protein [Gilliamella sp. ESL0441]QYN43846.1 mucoidy inhibitor MuiA family protein [Gilliamella sp. ESL0441]